VNRADERANGQIRAPDPYFDDLCVGAARRRFLSCEKVVETRDLLKAGSVHTLRIHRGLVDGVVEAPGGAHFTECPPDYGRDEAFQREYAAAAKDPEAWQAFCARWLDQDEAAYQAALRARREARGGA
jgi:glutaconate CoA-transferase subunit A